jgi:hypothetical protein
VIFGHAEDILTRVVLGGDLVPELQVWLIIGIDMTCDGECGMKQFFGLGAISRGSGLNYACCDVSLNNLCLDYAKSK